MSDKATEDMRSKWLESGARHISAVFNNAFEEEFLLQLKTLNEEQLRDMNAFEKEILIQLQTPKKKWLKP